jgi:hypothetical protein
VALFSPGEYKVTRPGYFASPPEKRPGVRFCIIQGALNRGSILASVRQLGGYPGCSEYRLHSGFGKAM